MEEKWRTFKILKGGKFKDPAVVFHAGYAVDSHGGVIVVIGEVFLEQPEREKRGGKKIKSQHEIRFWSRKRKKKEVQLG